MARPRVVRPPIEALHALVDGEGRIAVRVTPGARVEALEITGGRLNAKVCAQPQDGMANAAVQKLLASALDIAPSRLELLRGATSREKMFRIDIG